jgi:hypothetical protein
MADTPSDLEVLAVLMMDVRATVESMRRSITNTQASLEQFRHTRSKTQLEDIKDCLEQLVEECTIVTEAATEARKPIAKLEAVVAHSKPPSGEYTDRRRKPRDDDT